MSGEPRREAKFAVAGIRGTNFCRLAAFKACEYSSGFARLVCLALALVATTAGRRGLGAPSAEVPVINGNLGPCTADFTVKDSSSKAVYNAKIHVTVLYGFMNKR